MSAVDRRGFLGGSAALLALFAARGARAADAPSNFHAIYDDVRLRDRFFLFLKEVFHLVPEDRFHQLIFDATQAYATDEEIYRAIQAELPSITPFASPLTYAMPALAKQKQEMARQTEMLLTPHGKERFDGYVEIGTTGRYVRPLRDRLPIVGDTFVVNDLEPTNGPVDILERGGPSKVGAFLQLGDYDPIALPEGSVDLVTNFIGFHHCPLERLDGFVASLHGVLRPGGLLIVRDHDVDSPVMYAMVALAHDVFNAGTAWSWEDNAAQLRHFRSREDWTELLARAGFVRDDLMLAQRRDPSDNLLMAFVRT